MLAPLSMERVCEVAGTATEFTEHPLILGLPSSIAEGARCWLEVKHSTFLYEVTHIYMTLGHILSLNFHFWSLVQKVYLPIDSFCLLPNSFTLKTIVGPLGGSVG